VEGVELNLEDSEIKNFTDPLYGQTYLPRKFKVGFAIPPLNDVDIFTNCCGFIAIAGQGGRLEGFNLAVGGGMGRSHGNEATFPRIADVIGFLSADRVVEVARATLTIHRDFGSRSNRKHARLKYVLADRGAAWFREELQRRITFELQEARPFHFDRQGDLFGWHQQKDGRWFLGLFIETGRIKDRNGWRMKTGLRRVVETHPLEIRLTPGNNVILANIEQRNRDSITRVLAEHGIDVANQGTALSRASMACVALPTCGLALAEAERYLPRFVAELDALLAAVGLAGEEITLRMTGCPNGCSRPYMGEIGLVGKAPGRYQLYLGGNLASTRLNRLYRDNVKDVELLNELRPVLSRYATERSGKTERFGDWVARVLWAEAAGTGVPQERA
jgi:sulfite reductase (NADPH) hemoprotein beta-component